MEEEKEEIKVNKLYKLRVTKSTVSDVRDEDEDKKYELFPPTDIRLRRAIQVPRQA